MEFVSECQHPVHRKLHLLPTSFPQKLVLSVTQFPLQVVDTCLISCRCHKNKYIKNCKVPRSTVNSVRYVLQIGRKKKCSVIP